jgi:hypothetical protein
MSATQLELQASEARALLADLAAIGTEIDDETRELVVAGETTLAEAVASAIVEGEMAKAAARATAELILVLQARQERQEARAERIRERITQALGSLGLKRLPTAAGMVTLTAAPARVIVTDEEAIPDCWYREKVVRTLDKAGIRKALQEGVKVGGCELSNRPDTIRVRT